MLFLSYSGSDEAAVRTLTKRLKDSGIQVWLAPNQLQPGDTWQVEIEVALRSADAFAVYVGQSGVGGWMNAEVQIALDRKAKDPTFLIVPILGPRAVLENLSPFLLRFQYIDLRKGLSDSHLTRLIAAIGKKQEGPPLVPKSNEAATIGFPRRPAAGDKPITEAIDVIASLPEEEALQFKAAYEALVRVSTVDNAMVGVHARRCADLLARHAYKTLVGAPEGLDGESVIAGLLARSHISEALARHLRVLEVAKVSSTGRDALKCRKALGRVIDWFVSVRPIVTAHGYLLSDTYVVPENQITEADICQTVAVDVRAFAHVPGTPLPDDERVLRWYRRNPSIYTILKSTRSNQVVGYINAMPLFDRTFYDICSGKVDIEDLEHRIRRYDIPDFYNLYICSIAILDEYRTFANFTRMLDHFFVKVYGLAQKNIYVLEVVTDAATEEGEQMCISFGMRSKIKTSYNFPIYRVRMLPPEFNVMTEHARSVRTHYQEVYEHLRDRIEERQPSVENSGRQW